MIPQPPKLTRAEKRRAQRAEKKLKNKYPQPVTIYTEEHREVDGVMKKGYTARSNFKTNK
jgi:hypothetical protein